MSVSSQPLNQLSATDVLARYPAGDALIDRAATNEDPLQLLDWLVTQEKFAEAIDFLCYWMPPQYVVWWGCLCIWEIERDTDSPAVETAMHLIIQWLQNPAEAERLELSQIDHLLPPEHPARFLANAAKFSGGSMVAADLPPLSPPKYLFCRLGGAAIKLVGAKGQPADYVSTHKQIMQFGLEVLRGVNRWQHNQTCSFETPKSSP